MRLLVDENICTNIELLQYEVASRKEIITAFLQSSNNSDSKLFKEYQETYKEYFIAYNKAKEEMLKKYEVPVNSKWNLNFATRELTY